MTIEIDEKEVQKQIFAATDLFRKYVDSIADSALVQFAVDRYWPVDSSNTTLTSKVRLKYLVYADLIICMKNLGHDYLGLNFEAAPFNTVFHAFEFPSYTFGEFLKNTVLFKEARNIFDLVNNGPFVGNGNLSGLNIPKILDKTPFFDEIEYYYKLLFLISKYTTLSDSNIDKEEFEGLYAFSKYLDIDKI